VLSVFYLKGRILWSFSSVVGEQAQPPAFYWKSIASWNFNCGLVLNMKQAMTQ
jgi:hypothetical protein